MSEKSQTFLLGFVAFEETLFRNGFAFIFDPGLEAISESSIEAREACFHMLNRGEHVARCCVISEGFVSLSLDCGANVGR